MNLKLLNLLYILLTLQIYGRGVSTNEHCLRESDTKHPWFSYPGREIICINMMIFNSTTINLDSYFSVQLISVRGNLAMLKFSTKLKYLFIYQSRFNQLNLILPNKVHLHMAESHLPDINEETFRNSKGINSLGFHSNNNMDFYDNCFSLLGNLRKLIIFNQSLKTLRKQLFTGLNNLTTLVLNKNGLSELDEDTFTHLTSLETLNLDNNPIKVLKIDFTFLNSITTLSLVETELKNIYLPVFKPVRSLALLRFSSASIESLDLGELALAFPNLEVLYLQENAIDSKVFHILDHIKFSGLKVRKLPSSTNVSESNIFDISEL